MVDINAAILTRDSGRLIVPVERYPKKLQANKALTIPRIGEGSVRRTRDADYKT